MPVPKAKANDPWADDPSIAAPSGGNAPAQETGDNDWKIWQQGGAQPQTPEQPTFLQKAMQAGTDALTGIGKGALHTISGTDEWARQHLPSVLTNSNMGFGPPADLNHVKQMATPQGGWQKAGYGLEQVGEFLAPAGIEKAAAAKAAEFAPKLAPLARPIISALSSGAVNTAQGGDFATGAAAGGASGVIGEAGRALAPSIAEAALRVRGNQRLFGRTVGKAILEDTHGIRPETVGRTAGETIEKLSPEIDALDAQSAAQGRTASLVPARMGVDSTIARHQGNRAMQSAKEIEPIANFLKTDQLTGLPLAQDQPAPFLRALKRGLNEDYIGKWSLEQPPAQRQAARQAYGAMNEELHAASPGTQELDQRISSLMPVKMQAQRVASEAPTMQKALHRFGAHTGALTMGAAGAAGGYREGGIPGAVAGGVTGVLLPEMISSPEGQMALARVLHAPGTEKLARAMVTPTAQRLVNYLRAGQQGTGGQE